MHVALTINESFYYCFSKFSYTSFTVTSYFLSLTHWWDIELNYLWISCEFCVFIIYRNLFIHACFCFLVYYCIFYCIYSIFACLYLYLYPMIIITLANLQNHVRGDCLRTNKTFFNLHTKCTFKLFPHSGGTSI